MQHTSARFLSSLPLSRWRARLTRLIDDDRLKDRHWQSELREVELFENERWAAGEGIGWNKANLKPGERVAWTRGRDGWSGVTADGSGDVRSVVPPPFFFFFPFEVTPVCSRGNSSDLTFLLEPGWAFVETEDWRADIEAKWSDVGSNDCKHHILPKLLRSFVDVFCDPPAGWVYTNDAWLEPHASPMSEWKAQGVMTRRRRWTRRIYLNPTATPML
jgi:hypothetical protein